MTNSVQSGDTLLRFITSLKARQPDANRIALISLGFGVLANLLFYEGAPYGPGFTLWLSALGSVTCLLVQSMPGSVRIGVSFYAVLAVVASALLFLRSTPLLVFGLWLVILTSAGMVFLLTSRHSLMRTTVLQQVMHVARVPPQALLGFFPDLPKLRFSQGILDTRMRGILRGLLIATPVLILFCLLFASADAVVERLAENVIESLSTNLTQHLLIISAFSWLTAGLLSGLNRTLISVKSQPKWIKLGDEELLVILGLVAVLFVAFVVLQATYLFGGRATIEATTGLTLAEYARRGFFELLWVVGLTLVLLLSALSSSVTTRLFKPLAVVLVGCTIVMVVSAGQRLGIYVDEFGLSVDRLVASMMMVWLLGSLCWFVYLLLRETTTGLALGISSGGIAAVLVLAVLNPAALVAGVNLQRAESAGTRVDAAYLVALGADAVPTILRNLDRISVADYCTVGAGLLQRWEPQRDTYESERQAHWRSWNSSHARAMHGVQEHSERLQEMISYCVPFGRLQ